MVTWGCGCINAALFCPVVCGFACIVEMRLLVNNACDVASAGTGIALLGVFLYSQVRRKYK